MKVFIIDQTCRFPQYTSVLGDALIAKSDQVKMYVSGIPELYQEYYKNNENLFFDLRNKVFKIHTRDKSILKKGIKLIEYFINDIRLTKEIGNKLPDIVHFQYFPLLEDFPYFEFSKIKKIKKKGIKIVYTVHNVLPNNKNAEKLRPKYLRLYQAVDKLIVHTEESKRIIVNDFNIDINKIDVIPHGVLGDKLPSYNKEVALTKLSLNPKNKYVLFFGGINHYKGIEFLLEMFSKNYSENTNLILVGNGSKNYINEIKNSASFTANEQRIITDFRFVPDEQLAQYISAADIVVFPYKSITQSGALFLGLGKGKAVIATKLPGFEEVIEDGIDGTLINFGDIDGFNEAVCDLLSDNSKRNKYEKNALKKMEDTYSWENIANLTYSTYKSLI